MNAEGRPGQARLSPGRLGLLILAFLISLPAVTPRIYASDEIEFFAFLPSLWFDGDVSFENEYQYFYDRGIARSPAFHETFLERTTETGKRANFGTIGSAILWSPFYAAAHLLVRLRGGQADGLSAPYIAAVAYGSAMYGFAAVLLSIAIARRVLKGAPHPSSTLIVSAALATLLGTPLLFYMYIAPPMSHAPSAFAVSAFVLAWLVVREAWSTRGLMVLGALAGLMAMVREQDAFFAIGPAIDYLWTLGRRGKDAPRRSPAGLLAGAVTCGIVYVPQALAYLSLNGRIGPSSITARKMTWTAPHALEVLGSPEHGFFFWTPIGVLGMAGLCALAAGSAAAADDPGRIRVSDRRLLGVCMLFMVAAQVYVAGSVESWTLAGAFGQRRLVALTPLLTVGLAELLRLATARGRPVIAAVAVAVCIWWNVGLMVQFGSGLMNRQRIEVARIAYNNFVIVPRRLPELAYRYLFDRSSYYDRSER